MQTTEAVVQDPIGLHARPANQFVKLAAGFHSVIKVRKVSDTAEFNAKSITGLMRLGAVHGTHMLITAEGDDEADACAALKALVETGS